MFLGFRGWMGFGPETTYGTGVAPTKFIPFVSETLKLTDNKIFAEDIQATASRKRYSPGTRFAGGDIVCNVYHEGFATLFKHLLGSVSSAQVAASTAYDHTISIADTLPVGLSFEPNRGAPTAAAGAFRYVGSKLNGCSLACAAGEALRATFNVISRDEQIPTLSPAAASAPTYDDVDFFVFHEGQLKIDDYAGTPVEIEILGFDLNIANGLKEDKHVLNSRLRAAAPRNALRMVTGSFRTEIDDLVEYTRFFNGTEAEIILTFTSVAEIEAGYNYTITITMPRVVFTGETPGVGGPELLEGPFPFECLYDVTGTLPEIEIIVRDSDTSA